MERYSIKDLERFYGFQRDIKLEDANTNLRIVARALELGALDAHGTVFALGYEQPKVHVGA